MHARSMLLEMGYDHNQYNLLQHKLENLRNHAVFVYCLKQIMYINAGSIKLMFLPLHAMQQLC